MNRPYVEKLRIQNYGCIRDATFRLTPLHALIGPNDSGKSTVLRALKTLARTAEGTTDFRSQDRHFLVGPNGHGASHLEALVGTERYVLEPYPQPVQLVSSTALKAALAGAYLLRLDPDFLRQPCALIPDGKPLRFTDERGTGLGALYDALIVRDLSEYGSLNAELTRLFPGVKSIQLGNPTTSTKAIGVRLADDTVVPADLMSEGLLYYLAFAILPHINRTPILLVEEPENGLHPARIAEVIRVLRAISETTQVILATHSPLVINELAPDEVTVVTRSEPEGTQAKLMKDTPNFEERSKVYALGELWLSYANGTDEAPLLQGGPRP